MCEAVVRIRDKINADPYKDVGCTKRGDVIAVVADGWPWGPDELHNPDWRILKLPNVPLATAVNFLALEVDTTGNPKNRMLRKRGINLDLSNLSLPLQFTAWLVDDTRAQPTLTLNFTATQFVALKVVKTPLPDPNVL